MLLDFRLPSLRTLLSFPLLLSPSRSNSRLATLYILIFYVFLHSASFSLTLNFRGGTANSSLVHYPRALSIFCVNLLAIAFRPWARASPYTALPRSGSLRGLLVSAGLILSPTT